MKLRATQKALASREAKDSKKNLGREYVFDTFAKRYDKWYDKPFGKTAFKLEKECIEFLCKNLERPFLEIGVGTGRFAVALKMKHGIDKSILLKLAKERGIEDIRGEGENLPFVDVSFSAVFIIVTLCFVDDPPKSFKRSFKSFIGRLFSYSWSNIKRKPLQIFARRKVKGETLFIRSQGFIP